jgi:serine/threonine-protein kinase
MKVCTTCGAEYGDEKLFCERDGTPLRKSGTVNDLVGQVIADRYHITKKLGEGGMGQVYLAEHVKMGRRCAIKIMMPGTMADPEAISRFNREAANASRINHPNVCAIYDFGETPDGLIYLAMELIEGKSLTDLLEEAGTLPVARAAAMIQQTADALQAAHDLGIVHRDLKPDNIMVASARGQDVVKVVDFGIAKAIGGDEGRAQKVTKTGFVVGTPEYMSPEQLSGDPVDGRSDLYSLGLVFYRMLTGASPFPADSQQETMIKRLTDDPLPLAVARPDCRFPAEVQRILDRALARVPAERYRTAGDFGRDVRSVATHLTGAVDVEAGTQKVRVEDMRGAPPPTRVDPAVAGQRARPGPSTQPVRTAPAKRSVPALAIVLAVALLAMGGGVYAMRDRLFSSGGERVPAPADSTAVQPPPQPPESAMTRTAGTAETGTVVKPPPVRSSTTTPPRPDSAIRRPEQTAGSPPVTLPPVDDIFDPALRDGARQKSEAIFRRRELTDSIRAAAANMVAVAYQQDQNYREALTWAERSQDLRPTEAGKKLIDQLKQLTAPN